jgi:hypothetical protein
MNQDIIEMISYDEIKAYVESEKKYSYKNHKKEALESIVLLSESELLPLVDKYTHNHLHYRSARHFVMNYVSATLIEKEGFTWRIDEYGWVKQNEKFEEVRIVLGTKNSLQIGKSPKNSFFFGYSINLGGAGGASSLSVYDNSFKSFEEAKQAGLNYLKEGYLKTALTFSEDTTNFNRKIVAEFKKAIDFYLPPVGSQLRLF